MKPHNLREIILKTTILCAICILLLNSLGAQEKKTEPSLLAECWKFPTPNLIKQRMTADAKNVYFAEDGARISALSIITGKKVWSAELGGEIISNLIIDGTNLFVASRTIQTNGSDKSVANLRSLSAETGITNYSVEMPSSDQIVIGSSANRISAITSEADVTAFEPKNGQIIWNRRLASALSAMPFFSADEIAVSIAGKVIYVISVKNGDTINTFQTPETPTTELLMNKRLVWGDDRGNIFMTDRNQNNTVWKLKTGARITNLTASDSEILVASFDNFVYLVDSGSGIIKWKKRQAARIVDEPTVAYGSAVLQTYGENTASIIKLSNAKIISRLNLSENESFVQSPVFAANLFIFSTSSGLVAYGLNGCFAK